MRTHRNTWWCCIELVDLRFVEISFEHFFLIVEASNVRGWISDFYLQDDLGFHTLTRKHELHTKIQDFCFIWKLSSFIILSDGCKKNPFFIWSNVPLDWLVDDQNLSLLHHNFSHSKFFFSTLSLCKSMRRPTCVRI